MNRLPIVPYVIAPSIRTSVSSHVWWNEKLYRKDFQTPFQDKIVPSNVVVRTEKVTSLEFTFNMLTVGLRHGNLMTVNVKNLETYVERQLGLPLSSDIIQTSLYFGIVKTENYISRLSSGYNTPYLGSPIRLINWLQRGKYLYFVNEQGKIYRTGEDDWYKFCPELDTSVVPYGFGPIQNCIQLQTDTDNSFALIQWKNQFAVIHKFHEINEINVLDRGLFDNKERDYIFKVYDESVFYAPIEATRVEKHSVFVKNVKRMCSPERNEIILYGDKLKTFEVMCQRLVCITFDNFIEIYDLVQYNRLTLIIVEDLSFTFLEYTPRVMIVVDSITEQYDVDKGPEKFLIFAAENGHLLSVKLEPPSHAKTCCGECAEALTGIGDDPNFNNYICYHNLPEVANN